MTYFADAPFPERIAAGMKFGPDFSTEPVRLGSGKIVRNRRWMYPKRGGDASFGVQDQDDLDELLAHFLVMGGMADSFPFKDPSDHTVTQATGLLGTGGAGTGLAAYQLHKLYQVGSRQHIRPIKKPISVAVERNGTPVAEGAGAGQVSIDLTTGQVTFVADVTKNITAVTQANPGQVEAVGHGFTNGQQTYLSALGGMTQLNGQLVTVTVIDPDNFTIGVNTSGYTAYTSGGAAKLFPQPGETLTWAGEFYTPCHYGTDEMRPQVDEAGIYSWGPIPITEDRHPG